MACYENKCFDKIMGSKLDIYHHQLQKQKYFNYETIYKNKQKDYTVKKQINNQITILYSCRETY